jgi:hypothetical protein
MYRIVYPEDVYIKGNLYICCYIIKAMLPKRLLMERNPYSRCTTFWCFLSYMKTDLRLPTYVKCLFSQNYMLTYVHEWSC